MPLVDRSSHSVVLRIVYDGPPDAGKATSVRYLRDHLPRGSREGELRSDDDRGSLFDWLEVGCGWPGGDRVRCQLAVVPRQLPLARRRHHLLDSADAVVFVADSRAAAAPETGAALRSLVRGLGRRDVPLLLQANKQDLPDAQPPDGLHGALGLAARVPVIGARAIDGAGIVETFLRAVRLAAEHARAVLVAAEPGEGDPAAGALLRRTLETDATEGLATLDALSRLADPAAGPLMLDAADADLPATSVSDILTRTRRESVTRPLRVVRPPPGAVRPVPAAAAPGAELAAAETVTLEAFTVERTVVDRRQVPAGAFEPTPIELVTVEAFTVERTVVGLNSGAPATLAAGAAPAAIAYATPAPSPAAATDPPAPGPTAARPSPAFFGTDDDPTWELPGRAATPPARARPSAASAIPPPSRSPAPRPASTASAARRSPR
jgi:hypothetical protein